MVQLSSILLCIVGLSVCCAFADKPKLTLSHDKVKIGQSFTATCAVSVQNASNAEYYVAFLQNRYIFAQFTIKINQSVQWFHYTPLHWYGLKQITSHSSVYPNFAIKGVALNKNVYGRYTCTLLTKPFIKDVYSNSQMLSFGNHAPNTGTEPALNFANLLIVPIGLLTVGYSFG